jgi:hypothetical protein
MNKLLLIALTLIPFSTHAKCNEVVALSRILFAEAQGESISGVIAIGEASKSRAKRTNKPICNISGVTRKNPPERLKHYWQTFAKSILNDNRKPTIGDADSFNKGKKPNQPGRITRIIQSHVFYTMNGELK